ncbi:ABC transporter ATP-binding protein [Salirhabdus salicampi]|uniref:ABC transporter ATP-binding protein n=1 Tax=Salirhabdus salicampi TaxID=476102 RepID=UPI0020C50F0B|nr:ABC transporter ATP-binding protein [Salirhabdus salicampi]MCP8615746.1 ABC transporter ATP-binding protein [Salirhabdus salicampi]
MIQVKGLSHEFTTGKKGNQQVISVLRDINFDVHKGEIVSIIGRSGSGKSTLLNLISGFSKPSSGEIFINDEKVSEFNETEYSNFRLHNIGFIFQNYQLIPSMNAFENVELPLILRGTKEHERKKITEETLNRVGLEQFYDHYPSELSGGQQQRVSIARALVVNPPIIMADEPTGSLDSETEADLLSFIKELNSELEITFLIVTHDEKVAKIGNRVIEIQDGEIVERGMNYAF